MTANDSSAKAYVGLSRSEKPRLLPFNRKLRHLHGISLRNLAVSTSSNRPRGKTIDDAAIPYTLKSPAKLLMVSEESALSHSRSSTDLASQGRQNVSTSPPQASVPGIPTKPPSPGQSRPKFSLQRTNTSPRQRQQNYKDAVLRRTADVFFSIHCPEVNDPIYISEVMKDCMNPDFRFFDLTNCGTLVTRQDHLSVKVWVRSQSSKEWTFLIEIALGLRSLQYIGKSLENFHHPLPENSVLFHLSDGIYTSFTDIPVEEHPGLFLLPHPDKVPVRLEHSSSYDTLMRLSTLDECIRDAIATRQKLCQEIDDLIHVGKARAATNDEIVEARDSLASVRRAVATARKQTRMTKNKLTDVQKGLRSRRDAMGKGRETQEHAREHLHENTAKLGTCQDTHKRTLDEVTRQRRRVCENLLEIYPIEPVPRRSLAFTIRNLPLPNSNFQDTKEDVVSAALGHVAHLVYLLSFYLSVSLPYQIQTSSSTSLISDPISIMAGSRTFPLYIRGSVFYRFEYGVFLLNKDIELLASTLGLKILDIRQTLPNLKYVMFVATAGQGDLPSRKVGGVRGLIRDSEKRTPDSSRRGSIDSDEPAVLSTLKSRAFIGSGG